MFAAGIVVIVLVMKTKPTLDLTTDGPISSTPDQQGAPFGRLVDILRGALLPHLAAGLGLFLVSIYVSYTVLNHLFLPKEVMNGLLVVLLLVYGAFAFMYALLGAGVFALYQACAAWDNLIDRMLDKVKDEMLSKLEGNDQELAKDQAKVLVRGSVREAFQTARQKDFQAWPHWLSALCLGSLTWVIRSVLVAKIVKWSGRTVKISKIFASKVTLVGAVLLNLRFFALLLLGLVYAAGAGILFLNGLIGWWST